MLRTCTKEAGGSCQDFQAMLSILKSYLQTTILYVCRQGMFLLIAVCQLIDMLRRMDGSTRQHKDEMHVETQKHSSARRLWGLVWRGE